MAFKITEECINCGACEPECPNAAITAGEMTYLIDPAKCTECVGSHSDPQCAAVCPVACCVADPDNVENHEILEAKFRKLHG